MNWKKSVWKKPKFRPGGLILKNQAWSKYCILSTNSWISSYFQEAFVILRLIIQAMTAISTLCLYICIYIYFIIKYALLVERKTKVHQSCFSSSLFDKVKYVDVYSSRVYTYTYAHIYIYLYIPHTLCIRI